MNSCFNISSNILSCFLIINIYYIFNEFITRATKSFGNLLMKPACIVLLASTVYISHCITGNKVKKSGQMTICHKHLKIVNMINFNNRTFSIVLFH